MQNRAVQKTKRTNKQEIYLKSCVATKWKHRLSQRFCLYFVDFRKVVFRWKQGSIWQKPWPIQTFRDSKERFRLSRPFHTVKTVSDCQDRFRLSTPFQTVMTISDCPGSCKLSPQLNITWWPEAVTWGQEGVIWCQGGVTWCQEGVTRCQEGVTMCLEGVT